MLLGPTFGNELIAAGLGGLPLGVSSDGRITGREKLTDAQNSKLDAVIAAHDPTKQLVPLIPLYTIQARMDTEGVWDTYVNFMFGLATRRNAFLKTIFIGQPLPQDNVPFRTSMAAAGISAAAIDRILAPVNGSGNGG
jgi:hypothetical protein